MSTGWTCLENTKYSLVFERDKKKSQKGVIPKSPNKKVYQKIILVKREVTSNIENISNLNRSET